MAGKVMNYRCEYFIKTKYLMLICDFYTVFNSSRKHKYLFTSYFEKYCDYVNETRMLCEEAFMTILTTVCHLLLILNVHRQP